MSETRTRTKKMEAFHASFRRAAADVLDPSFQSRETPLYFYHCRTVGGWDFQYFPKFPCKEKLSVQELEAMSRTIDAATFDRGYVYEYFDSDFILRLEGNPNNQSFDEIASVLHRLRPLVGDWRVNIKINRMDIAIDYQAELDLALISVDGVQKECGFWTRDKFNGLYFGAEGSEIRFRFYDKVLERKRAGVIVPAPLYRSELEFKESHFMHESLAKVFKAFKRVRFHGGGIRHPLDPEDQAYVGLILFKAAHCGLSHVLAELPRRDADYYRGVIESLDLKALPHPLDVLHAQFPPLASNLHTQIKEAFGYETV